MKDTEQLRDLLNEVRISGKLAELEVREGNTQKGVAFMSVKGVIQYGQTGAETLRFEKYAQEKTKDGKDSVAYKNLVEWVESAVPMTKDSEKPTKLNIVGSVKPNDYWSTKNERVVEGVTIEARYFNPYEPPVDDGNAIINIEGYIKSITDEVRGKGDDAVATGRKKVTLISTYNKEELILKDLKIEADMAREFLKLYSEGDTVKLYLSYQLHEGEKVVSSQGFGKQRTTEGKSYKELIITGGEMPYTATKDVITSKILKVLSAEREEKLAEIKEKAESGANQSNSNKGFGNTQTSSRATKKPEVKESEIEEPDLEEDDMPF